MLISLERFEYEESITFQGASLGKDKRAALSHVARGGYVIEADTVSDIELALAELFGERVYYIQLDTQRAVSGHTLPVADLGHSYLQFVTKNTLLAALKIKESDWAEAMSTGSDEKFDETLVNIPMSDSKKIVVRYRKRTPQVELERLRAQREKEEAERLRAKAQMLKDIKESVTKYITQYKTRKPAASTVSKCVTFALNVKHKLFDLKDWTFVQSIALILYADAVYFRQNPDAIGKKRVDAVRDLLENYMSNTNEGRDPFLYQTWVELKKT